MEEPGENKERSILRKKAEELWKENVSRTSTHSTEADILMLIHELEVHQIELELQNEELMLAKELAAKLATEKYAELYDFAPSGYFTFSKDGEIIELNLCGSQMLGKERSHLKNSRFNFFISDDSKPTFNLFLRNVFKSKTKVSCEVTLLTNNKEPLYALLSGIVTENEEHCLVTMVDITELKLTEKELIKAKEKAEESDNLKTSFLHNLSHEIRTPMNAIMGFSSLLVRHYNDKQKLDHYSNLIHHRCVDLLDIINDILDIAKIESGQLPVHIEECELNLLFAELSVFFKESQKRFNKQHIKLDIQAHCNPSTLVITTDAVKLKQIFINLIGNALKFTDKGEIKAGCKLTEKNNLEFYVSDTGIGIPEHQFNKIFERFTQLDNGADRTYAGTGLGLSIVKGLVNLLGGNIWLTSELQKGTTFYFTLPDKIADKSIQPKPIAPKSVFSYNFTGKTILIVEDDEDSAEFLKEALVGTGINIIHTSNGREAIEKALTDNSINLVLMDISLPEIDGYEATRQIKNHKNDLIIIAQTAYATPEDKKMAIAAGCNDYISKPFELDHFLFLINKNL